MKNSTKIINYSSFYTQIVCHNYSKSTQNSLSSCFLFVVLVCGSFVRSFVLQHNPFQIHYKNNNATKQKKKKKISINWYWTAKNKSPNTRKNNTKHKYENEYRIQIDLSGNWVHSVLTGMVGCWYALWSGVKRRGRNMATVFKFIWSQSTKNSRGKIRITPTHTLTHNSIIFPLL